MKSKKFTYFLGLLVLIVWGVILYRIFDTVAGEEDGASFNYIPNKIDKEAYNDYEIVPDTTPLQLNYKDPFGLQEYKKEEEVVVTQMVSLKPPISAPQPMNWNFIKYSGYIRNQGSKDLVALVTINGKFYMLSEGETEERVKLVKNLQDSIKVVFNGNTAYINIR